MLLKEYHPDKKKLNKKKFKFELYIQHFFEKDLAKLGDYYGRVRRISICRKMNARAPNVKATAPAADPNKF